MFARLFFVHNVDIFGAILDANVIVLSAQLAVLGADLAV